MLPAGNTDVKVAEQYAHNLVELAYATVTKYGLTGSDADMQVRAAVMVGEAEIHKLNPPLLELAQYRAGEAYQEMQHAQQKGQLFPGDAAAAENSVFPEVGAAVIADLAQD